MAKLVFDILRLYEQAFGAGVGLPFPVIQNPESDPSEEPFEEMTAAPGINTDPSLKGDFNFKSPFGGAYYLPIKMGSKPNDLWQLPNEPIISIQGGKMIKETSIRRGKGRGTVTEERGLKDYQIIIRGLAINETEKDYPESDMVNLRSICEAEGVVYVQNYLARLYNIQKITIKAWDFPRFPGSKLWVQPYIIRCKSDMDFDDYKRIIDGSAA